MSSTPFLYHEAFDRNIGWITPEEQEKLRQTTVAIAGMGGVGGNHLLTLCRLGVSRFHLSDFDVFELANFNRQVGATVSHIGKNKLDVMIDMAKDINPEIKIKTFEKGVNENNADEFLNGVDVYLDSIDVFSLKLRKLLFKKCHEKKIYSLTVGPVGLSAALMNFSPDKMSFHEYFGFKDTESEVDQLVKFVVGLTPTGVHAKSLVLPDRLDLKAKKAPSTFMACQLCSGVAGTEILKYVTGRGPQYFAPYSLQFDAFSNQYKRHYQWGGGKNPLFLLKAKLAKSQLAGALSS